MNTITPPVPTKPFWASKTLWFNTITTLVGLAGVVPHPAAMAVAGVGNVILRVWLTDNAKLTP